MTPRETSAQTATAMPQALPRETGGNNGPLMLLLALNLILLAFFILLNAVTPTADKNVREGMNQGTGVGMDPTSNMTLGEGASIQRQVQEDMRGLVANRLRLLSPALDTDATGVQLTLPQGKLFVAGAAELTADGGVWLENLRELLAGPGGGWEGMLLVLGRPGDAPLLARRVVAVGRALGVETLRRVSVGYGFRSDEAVGRVLLVLKAPAGRIADRDAERMERGLGESGGELQGLGRGDMGDAVESGSDGRVE